MDSIPQKTCARCKISQSLDQFYRCKASPDGLYAYCKACKLAYSRQTRVREQHSAHRKELAVRTRSNDLRRIREHKTEYRQKQLRRFNKYIEKPGNRDKVLEQQRKHWHRSPERREANRKRMYHRYYNDPEYKRKQFARSNATTHKRRARLSGGGSHTAKEWQALCEKYDHRCLCCGEEKPLTKDHVIPVFPDDPMMPGGSDNISNIQPLCLECNLRKSNRYIDYRPAEGD